MEVAGLFAALTVAITLAVAAVAKIRTPHINVESVKAFGVPPALANPVGTALPIVEGLLALLMLVPASRRFGGVGAFILFGLFTVAIVRSLRKGRAPVCHCFGALSARPVDASTVVRNSALMFLAAVAAFV